MGGFMIEGRGLTIEKLILIDRQKRETTRKEKRPLRS